MPAGARQDTAPDHDSTVMALLHLCLAVLTGFAALVIAGLLAFVGLTAASRRLSSPGTRSGRTRSPPSNSVRLAQLCLLRC